MSNDRMKKSNAGRSDDVVRTADGRPIDRPASPASIGSPSTTAATPIVPSGSVSRMITEHWKLIAAVAAACTLIALAIAAMQPRRYQATAVAAVAPAADTLSASEVLRGVEVLERRTVVATVAALASTTSVRDLAAPGETGDFSVNATVMPNTNLFRIAVDADDAARAAAIANRIPALLSEQTRAMFRYYVVTTVSPATQPGEPFSPRLGRAAATGLVIGLLLGLIAAFIADNRRAVRVG